MGKRISTSERPATHWVEEVERIRVGVHPRRQDIIDRLAAFGPLSVRDLAHGIGAKPSALYHHLKLLKEAGLVVERGFDVSRRKREQLYGTPARNMRLRLRPSDPANREVVQQVVKALGRQIERDFSLAQAEPSARTEGETRNLGLRRLCGSPDAESLAKINALLEQIGDLLSAGQPSPGDGVVLTWTIAPLVGPSPSADFPQE